MMKTDAVEKPGIGNKMAPGLGEPCLLATFS